MGTLTGVTLDIRSSNCGTPMYPTTATLENGTNNPQGLSYSYSYGGGSDGAGDQDVTFGSGEQEFEITLVGDRRYHLVDVAFGSSDTQLSKKDQDTYKVKIKDSDTATEDDYYQLLVKDTSNGDCAFWCDPRVSNKVPD